jgi:hypothetical protein
MTIARRLLSTSFAALSAVAVASCTTGGPGPSSMASAPKGVEGSWVDAEGTGVSSFSAGNFQTVATDTGQKLAEGSYTMTGAGSVQINGTSLVRQGQPVSFNCIMVSTSQLNCTSAANRNFVLTRRG